MNTIKISLVGVLLLLTTFGYSQKNHTITVYGNCGMCQDRIETAAMTVDGVKEAHWDADEQKLSVMTSEEFDIDKLHQTIATVGHDTDKYKATDEVYNNLHGCCQYRVDEEDTHSDDSEHDHSTHEKIKINFSKMVDGMVYAKEDQKDPMPLDAVNVYWADTNEGTYTDKDGFFELRRSEETDLLVFQYIGLESDTIDMSGQSTVAVTLQMDNVLDDVTIIHRKKSTEVSFINPVKVSTIGKKELCKAACCSLSESFETTPAVDVTFTDAITGTRKIEMLGLAGPNVQIMRENLPYVRGMAAISGLGMTPGSWIGSMQLNTGAGSVVNGPEAITGQINVELRKPEDERLYINLYANQAQRIEGNIIATHHLNDQWSTALLLHGNSLQKANDRNDDNFYDMPLTEKLYALNRWKYKGDNGIVFQAGIKGGYSDSHSGTLSDVWNADLKIKRIEGWSKIGKVFSNPDQSIGLQLSFSNHDQDGMFGNRRYDAMQSTFYANLIYADKLGTGKMKVGTSLIVDKTEEKVIDTDYDRMETMPGVFVEYSNDISDKVSILAGLRTDYHNIFGMSVTPRLHFKYNPDERTAIRLSAGRGQRTTSVFAENIGLFASNRAIKITSENNDTPYGLNQEVAYNFGASFTKEWLIDQRSLLFSVDYFYTTFTNQIVVDYDQEVKAINFYNLDGKSISHSVQTQLDYEVTSGVDVRLAYRYNDVKTQYQQGYLNRALVPKHRAFANVGYRIGQGWEWDGTLSWTGKQRLPDTTNSPAEYRQQEESESFFVFNTQLTKNIDNWSFYLGAENLFNYVQKNPIVNASNPGQEYFDASMIWGPIMGRNIYIGMRYSLK